MLSLRRTAYLIGVDKAYVSRRVHASKPVKGFEVAKYATYDSKGRIAGFNFPSNYPFPKSEDVRKGSLSGGNWPESAVNRVNVDRPLHVNLPANQDSNGENPQSERGFAKPRNDVDESSINRIKIDDFETGYDTANRVLTPDHEDALWRILPENEPETKVNAVNVDRQSPDIDSPTDNPIDRCMDKDMYKHTDKVPHSMASTSYSSKLPVLHNGQQLDGTETADLIEKNPWFESVLLPALGLGILALGVDYAVNKEDSMASRIGRWLKEVSQPNETEPANLPPDMPWEEDQNLYGHSGFSINPALWHP